MQEDPPHAIWGTPLVAQRLSDGQHVALWDEQGEWFEAQPGAYVVAGERLFLLRPNDAAVGHMASMLGLPVSEARDGHHRAQLVHSGQGVDILSLLIKSWRLEDEIPWPWVNHLGAFGGLAAYLQRVSDGQGYHYDPEQGCYVDAQGVPVRIGGDSDAAVHPGDLLTGGDGQEVGTISVLLHDAGQSGLLDPADQVLSTQRSGGAASWQVEQAPLGMLFDADQRIHHYRRDRQRVEQHLERRVQGDNPVWSMEPQRVWMLVAGMLLIIISLLRWGRKRRHKST
ncbi:MAG: hypothetical protein EA401_00955 [Planctomycetota bacterium]|nr:MAG: hypothetical protein EA401_00955 [Planctomycetota bacterium]